MIRVLRPVSGPNGVGLDAERIQQLENGLCRHIAQRHHADALARFAGAVPVQAAGTGFVGRQQAISTGAVAHQRDIGHAQRIFQHVQRVGFRDRAHRGQRHGSLHARIDGVADAQYVTEDDLCHRGDRRVFEIEVVARAGTDTVPFGQGRARRRRAVAEVDRGLLVAAALERRWRRCRRSGAATGRASGSGRRCPGRGGLSDCSRPTGPPSRCRR